MIAAKQLQAAKADSTTVTTTLTQTVPVAVVPAVKQEKETNENQIINNPDLRKP
jgi:hypothetical protein